MKIKKSSEHMKLHSMQYKVKKLSRKIYKVTNMKSICPQRAGKVKVADNGQLSDVFSGI